MTSSAREYGRPLPATAQPLAQLAAELNLSCPQGRALVVLNRRMHTWPTIRVVGTKHAYRRKTEREVLERTRLATARRWLAHWERGGSLRSLRMSHEQQVAVDRRKRERGLSEAQLLRLYVRRARRQQEVTNEAQA